MLRNKLSTSLAVDTVLTLTVRWARARHSTLYDQLSRDRSPCSAARAVCEVMCYPQHALCLAILPPYVAVAASLTLLATTRRKTSFNGNLLPRPRSLSCLS
ncbi:hypothetical protein J6590_027244 [Homalodisca vitripennis]|nr:hypothetical protein J6590_027244 [Homalodisca vitripennis]